MMATRRPPAAEDNGPETEPMTIAARTAADVGAALLRSEDGDS